MKLNSELKGFIGFLLIMLLIALIFAFVLFGVAGAMVVLGMFFISIPFYLMLNNFEVDESEKFVFSILFGLTIFPSLVYLLGLVISFKMSIVAIFIVLITIAFGIGKI